VYQCPPLDLTIYKLCYVMLRYDCWDLTTVMLCYDWFHFLFVTNQRAMVKFYVYGTLLCFVALCLVCIAVCCAIP